MIKINKEKVLTFNFRKHIGEYIVCYDRKRKLTDIALIKSVDKKKRMLTLVALVPNKSQKVELGEEGESHYYLYPKEEAEYYICENEQELNREKMLFWLES